MNVEPISSDNGSGLPQTIPDQIEPVVYFLQEYNTPQWHLLIWGVLVGAFLLSMLVYWHYQRK